MRRLLLALLFVSANASMAADFDDRSGILTDTARDRKIPYKIYYPKPLQGRYPVIIFSHGLGGSREGNEQLGKHLASHGFVMVHIQHEGSDEALLGGIRDRRALQARLSQSLRNPTNAQNRFLDVPFTVAELARVDEQDKVLKGHLDLQRLGMAGHSYGAVSTMVAAGERVGVQLLSYKVPTIRAGLVLSPSAPRELANAERIYADVNIPLFHMTGTRDESLVDARNVSAADRVIPYRKLAIPNQYLLVLDQAEHMTFSGRRVGTRIEADQDKRHLVAVLNGSLQFFNAYLGADKNAEKWLRTEYKKSLDPKDTFEFK